MQGEKKFYFVSISALVALGHLTDWLYFISEKMSHYSCGISCCKTRVGALAQWHNTNGLSMIQSLVHVAPLYEKYIMLLKQCAL